MIRGSWDYKSEEMFKKAQCEIEYSGHQLTKCDFSSSITSSCQAIEFSIKSLYRLTSTKHSTIHKIEKDEFKELGRKLSECIKTEEDEKRFERLYLISNIWLHFYVDSKYTADGVGEFGPVEANCANKNANECWRTVEQIRIKYIDILSKRGVRKSVPSSHYTLRSE